MNKSTDTTTTTCSICGGTAVLDDDGTPCPNPVHRRPTLRPACTACGNYLMPCTATATGIHPAVR